MTEERIDGEETKEKKKPKKSLKRELMEDVIMIVFVLVTVWVIKNYVLINAVVAIGIFVCSRTSLKVFRL